MVVQQVETAGGLDFNAATGEFEDLVGAGVIDPAKVTEQLQNAASITALLLTTETLVTDKPEEGMDPAGAAAMGGMGVVCQA